ncbi:MAG: hypothetical protein QME51_07725 [Planctomycetota bacterium]|nr:hypothetical protein [Planctomycetota bacterium]
MKKTLLILLTIGVVVPSVVLAGWFSSSNSSNSPNTNNVNTFFKEAATTELQQRKHIQSAPAPVLEKSQERKNLIARLNRFNSDDKISYIYLLSFGKVMAFYTVRGKVSSVNSLLTNPEQVIDDYGRQCDQSNIGYGNYGNCYVVSSPDIDGSYGSNGDAIFFFTTEDAYVEWNGEYMLADQPLKMTTQPELVRQIK